MSASGRLLVFVLVGLLAACAASQPLESVPDREEAPGYRSGMVLRLKHDRLLQAPPGGWTAPRDYLLEDSTVYITEQGSLTVEEFRRHPELWPKIRGIVPADALLTVRRLEYRTHFALDDWYEVHAEITSGAFAGREVDLGHISRRFPGDPRLWVDTEEFEVVR